MLRRQDGREEAGWGWPADSLAKDQYNEKERRINMWITKIISMVESKDTLNNKMWNESYIPLLADREVVPSLHLTRKVILT